MAQASRLGWSARFECPDFERNVAQWQEGNERSLVSIFGWQRYEGDAHHWGWTVESLSGILKAVGFSDVLVVAPRDYHSEFEPCIRIEAIA